MGAQAYGYYTIVSPLFITALLLGLSGLPLLESGANRKYGTQQVISTDTLTRPLSSPYLAPI